MYLSAAIQFLLIFLFDVSTPHCVAVPIWSPPSAMVPGALICAVSTVLAFVGLAVSMVEESTAYDLMNRVLAIGVVWLSVLVIFAEGVRTRTT